MLQRRDNKKLLTRRPAFTLVELLTVIVIIVLLAAILTPTVQMAIKTGYNVRTKARIAALQAAIGQYHQETNYYPGQPYARSAANGGQIDGGGGNIYTGTQWLAYAMFTKQDSNNVSDSNNFPVSGYLSYDPDFLKALGSPTKNNTISDSFPKPMAICYYPSRLGKTDSNQYVYADNSAYTDNFGGSDANFRTFIDPNNPKNNGFIPNSGSFLLIAPGIDRMYFTADDPVNK